MILSGFIIVDQDKGDFNWVVYDFEEQSIWYADDHELNHFWRNDESSDLVQSSAFEDKAESFWKLIPKQQARK